MEEASGFIIRAKVQPCAVATWDFGRLGLMQCAPLLEQGHSAVEAVEVAIRTVELDTQDQYYVGVGGYPNAAGVMELDAAIMDHELRYGAVMSLPSIANPISVARSVMEKCPHNILTGNGALQWAQQQGFIPEDILTDGVRREWLDWLETQKKEDPSNNEHDTVGVICLDQEGRLAAGTSTSGWRFKLPGRVGDSPVIGSGLYCDGDVGAAVATGDGEEIMRTCATFLVVELMRQGVDVQAACVRAVQRIASLRPAHSEHMHSKLVVGVLAMDKYGRVGAASTLGEENLHRGRPFFPSPYWRPQGHDVLHASTDGASTS